MLGSSGLLPRSLINRDIVSKLFRALVYSVLGFICLGIGYSSLYSAGITFVVLVVAMVCVATFIEPFVGLVFYLMCLYVRPFEILEVPPSLPVMKFLAILALAAWLLKVIAKREKISFREPQNLLIIAFLFILMLSNRGYIYGTINSFSEFSKIIVIYFLIANLITNESRLRITFWALVLSTTYLAVHGILLSKGVIIGDVELVHDTRVQSTGIFGDPNDLAMTLVVGIPFVVYLFFHERFIPSKVLMVACGCLMLYCIVLTGSRGGSIAFVVVTYLLLRRKVGTVTAGIFTLACIAVFLIIAPPYTIERIRSASVSEGTGLGRIELWYAGWLMFLSNPVTGMGMNTYAEYAGLVAHNSFFHVAAETGIMGLIIWIGLFYFVFKGLLGANKASKKDEESSLDKETPYYLMVSLIGGLICAFFLSRQYSYVLYLLIALSISICRIHGVKDKDVRATTNDALLILGGTFGLIMFWYLAPKLVL